jgi:hypothetical protein
MVIVSIAKAVKGFKDNETDEMKSFLLNRGIESFQQQAGYISKSWSEYDENIQSQKWRVKAYLAYEQLQDADIINFMDRMISFTRSFLISGMDRSKVSAKARKQLQVDDIDILEFKMAIVMRLIDDRKYMNFWLKVIKEQGIHRYKD